MPVVRYVSVTNYRGRAVGESHPRAVLTDEQVEDMRAMSERLGLSDRSIARHFNVPRRTVRSILSYDNRPHSAPRVIKYVRPI